MALGKTLIIGGVAYGVVAYVKKWWPFRKPTARPVRAVATVSAAQQLNQAINFPVQRLASSVTGSALVEIEDELLKLRGLSHTEYIRLLLDARKKVLTTGLGSGIMYPLSVIFNEVHDEITVDLHPDTQARDTEVIIETMRAVSLLRKLVPTLKIPFAVKPKFGTHWGGD